MLNVWNVTDSRTDSVPLTWGFRPDPNTSSCGLRSLTFWPLKNECDWLTNTNLGSQGVRGGCRQTGPLKIKRCSDRNFKQTSDYFSEIHFFFCTESIHSQVSACAALEDNRGTACSSRRVWRLCDVIISTASVTVKTSCVQPVRVEESTTCLNFTDYFSVIKTFLHSCRGLPFAFPQQRAAEGSRGVCSSSRASHHS